MNAPRKLFELLVDGGMDRLKRSQATREDFSDVSNYQRYQGLMLAVLANYVSDEIWDHAMRESVKGAQEYEPCDECGHPMWRHGKDGCEVERGDGYRAGSDILEALGPCCCQTVTTEVA